MDKDVTGGDRIVKGGTSVSVSVRATPLDSLKRLLGSFAYVSWLLLCILLFWETLQYLRFTSETRGFLEASEAALYALGDAVEVGATEEHGGVSVNTGPLKEELARRLVTIYARNRFLWPFSALFV